MAALLVCAAASAQTSATTNIIGKEYPKINPDRSVIFKIDDYRPTGSFYYWVCAILVNFHRMDIRKAAVRPKFSGDGTIPEVAAPESHDISDQMDFEMTAEAVRAAVRELPDNFREVVVLKYFDDMSLEDIAMVTGLNVGTVKSRLHYAKEALYAKLHDTELSAKFTDRLILATRRRSFMKWTVGAVAMLHTLADQGECEILATCACTVDGVSPQVLELLNAYYGRPKLPVGRCLKGESVFRHEGGHEKFVRLVADYPEYIRTKSVRDFEPAVNVYRKALAAAEDRSVTVCSLGFLTNMRDLLVSGPDAYSPLTGRELVAKKVKLWVAMACNYPNGAEYNSRHDAEASKLALAEWPTPIVFTDFQYGRTLYAGRAVAEMPAVRSPVKDVFANSLTPRAEIKSDSWDQLAGHPSWDETAVLIAVRGLDLFNVERGTYRMVGDKGDDEWIADEKSPNCRITEKTPRAEVGKIIDELICVGPKPAFPVTAKIPAPKAPAGFEWVDETIAKIARNYETLLANAEKAYTKEAPYPRSFIKSAGKLKFSKDWDWCSGFFQGSLWYLYEATGDLKWRAAAEKYCDEQAHIRFSNLHHDLGFMFLPSAGQGLRLTGNAKYAEWLYDAARTMTTRFRPNMRSMQSWGYWGEAWKKKYHAPVIIDNMLNLELWEWAGKNPASGELTPERDWLDGEIFLDMAEAHADTSIGLLIREDGSTYHVADCDPKTGKVVEYKNGQAIGHWSRGQGWAIFGYEMMYRYTGKKSYLDTAMKCADYALTAPNVPEDRVPYWDYLAPNIPNEEQDSSAAAVIGCGLLRLSRVCPDAAKAEAYRNEAITIAKSLSTSKHFAEPDELGGFAMRHFVGSKPDNAEVDVPMNYADYYYLELLMEFKRH